MRVRTLVAVLSLAALLPCAAQTPAGGGVFTDISTGALGPSVDRGVYAVAPSPDGSVYIAGRFANAGGHPAGRVAQWDGTAWHTLDGGLEGPYIYLGVEALAVGPNGDLVAGGPFTSAGGVPVNAVARWDGTAWSPIGDGLFGPTPAGGGVRALAFGPDGRLCAGGSFSTVVDAPLTSVACWDGTAWQSLSAETSRRSVHALAFGADGSLYAGGTFTTIGGVTASRVARWDGTAWSALGAGMDDWVDVIEVDATGRVYAAGRFTEAGGAAAEHIAQWDGVAWSPLGDGLDAPPTALTVGPYGRLIAGGSFTTMGGVPTRFLAQWDGTAWSDPDDGPTSSVYALATASDGSVVVGGEFLTTGQVAANYVARWDGAAWSGFGSAVRGGLSALAVGPDGNLYAGGDGFRSAADRLVGGVARFDGASWHPVGGALYGVQALAFAPDASLYAGGYFTSAGGTPVNNVAQWDGTAWSALGDGPNGHVAGYVNALVVGPDGSLYAGGKFPAPAGSGVPPHGYNVSRWDGTAWAALGSGTANGVDSDVFALAVGPDGSLYVGGEFQRAGGVLVDRIARWDGAAWHALGTGIGGSGSAAVLSLAVGPDGTLYTGGRFETAGGVPAVNIAAWDGTTWRALEGGSTSVGSQVEALAFGADGRLYAGSGFTYPSTERNFVQWDGTAWSPAGTLDGVGVFALTTDPGGDLFVGGHFERAGGVVSPNVVRYTPGAVAVEPAADASGLDLTVAPNPTRGSATVTVTHAAGPLTVEVMDALGRRVAVVTDDAPVAGSRTVALPLDGVAPGVYVVRVQSGREAVARTLVIVR